MILVIQGDCNPRFIGKVTALFRKAAKSRTVNRGAWRRTDG